VILSLSAKKKTTPKKRAHSKKIPPFSHLTHNQLEQEETIRDLTNPATLKD
jgi:hypothetical protein